MSDDPVVKMYETQAALEKIKEEMEEIQKQNNELKNGISFKSLIETVKELQYKFDVLQQAVTTLSNRASSHDDKFSELNENLRRLNETLNKDDTISSHHNKIPEKQNETIQVLNTNENNCGGQDEVNRNSLLMLENNEQSWKELNIKLLYPTVNHGAQFLNNNLYIFGGGTVLGPSNWTYKLSKSLQWEKMADMNQKRCDISNTNVTLNNQIWVCGGVNKERTPLKSVEMYDTETNIWKYMKQMNQCRWKAAAAVVNGKIFCSGGINEKYIVLGSVECYDSSSDVWTLICNMPQYIQGHSAVEMNGNLIVIGGGYGREYLKNVWALDLTDKNAVWIKKPSMSIPRSYFSTAKVDESIFVCGGCHGGPDDKTLDLVEIFDGENWKNGPKMPTKRNSGPSIVIPMKFARSLT